MLVPVPVPLIRRTKFIGMRKKIIVLLLIRIGELIGIRTVKGMLMRIALEKLVIFNIRILAKFNLISQMLISFNLCPQLHLLPRK